MNFFSFFSQPLILFRSNYSPQPISLLSWIVSSLYIFFLFSRYYCCCCCCCWFSLSVVCLFDTIFLFSHHQNSITVYCSFYYMIKWEFLRTCSELIYKWIFDVTIFTWKWYQINSRFVSNNSFFSPLLFFSVSFFSISLPIKMLVKFVQQLDQFFFQTICRIVMLQSKLSWIKQDTKRKSTIFNSFCIQSECLTWPFLCVFFSLVRFVYYEFSSYWKIKFDLYILSMWCVFFCCVSWLNCVIGQWENEGVYKKRNGQSASIQHVDLS